MTGSGPDEAWRRRSRSSAGALWRWPTGCSGRGRTPRMRCRRHGCGWGAKTRQAIDNLAGWLTTVVGRVCIDMLRSRKAKPEASYDDRLPDMVVTPTAATSKATSAINGPDSWPPRYVLSGGSCSVPPGPPRSHRQALNGTPWKVPTVLVVYQIPALRHGQHPLHACPNSKIGCPDLPPTLLPQCARVAPTAPPSVSVPPQGNQPRVWWKDDRVQRRHAVPPGIAWFVRVQRRRP